jgi:hypothetical protein
MTTASLPTSKNDPSDCQDVPKICATSVSLSTNMAHWFQSVALMTYVAYDCDRF